MAVRFDADGEDYTRALTLGSQTALTVSCWFKISVDRNDFSSIFFIDNGTSDNWGMQTGTDGTTMATVFDASTQEGMGSLTVGTWYYVCLSTNGTTGNLYYKTASATSLTTQSVTSVTASINAATLRIGESPWGAEWLNGCIAAFKVYTGVALSAAEADLESRQYLPSRVANLQGFYPLVRAETADYSGNGRTLSGGTGAATEDGPPIPWRVHSPRIILPIAATGDLVCTPTAIDSAEAFGTPTAVLDIDVTPTGIASAETFGAVTAVLDLNVTPTGIASAETFGAVAAVLDLDATPTSIASGEAFGTPIASMSGSITGTPTSIGSAEAFGTPVAALALIAAAAGIESAESFGSPIAVLTGVRKRLRDLYLTVPHRHAGDAQAYVLREGVTAYGNAAPLSVKRDPSNKDLDGKTYVFRGGYIHESEDPTVIQLWIDSGFEVEDV